MLKAAWPEISQNFPLKFHRTNLLHWLAIGSCVANTYLTAAREAGINVQANIHGFNDPLPDEFYLTRRFGDARTWGEAVLYRIRRQRPPAFEIDNPNGAVRRLVLNGGKNE